MFFFSSCEKLKRRPGECERDSQLLSELRTKSNYYLPFALCNDIDDKTDHNIYLNNEIFDLDVGYQREFEKSGFFELVLDYVDAGKVNDTILFTLVTEEREHAEWGIEAWVPAPIVTEPVPSCEIVKIYPRQFLPGMGLPFIFYL